eukprot:symbB.v1.2.008429.t1/scaffold522.1/size192531/2
MLDMLRWFASAQIRNVAVLAGNIATASPISDMNPVLIALNATLILASAGQAPREVRMKDFFKSYRVVDMQPTEVICAIKVPDAEEFEFVRSFKQHQIQAHPSQRCAMDRRALQLELLCSRGCVAPEDLCRCSAVSREWHNYVDAEAPWLTLAKMVTLRKLPVSMETGPSETTQDCAKWQLLQRYRPAFKVRCQVRHLLQRVSGFWQLWSPSVAQALRCGLSDMDIEQLESCLGSALPEDFAEFLRWCDGHELEAFWFAEAQPGALAFRITRLLSAQEMLQKACTPHGWLPVACSREGALTCLRLVEESESTATFGEVWCGATRGDFDTANLARQSTSFTEYLKDYVGLLESIPRQFAEEQLLTPQSLSQVLPQLFASPRIYCDERSSWITTGLGKGKGNLWQRVDRSQPLRIIFPRFGKTGKRSSPNRPSFGSLWLNPGPT